jgi:FKBP-type peptidyl-prolyl cis-trans isomerase 2
MQRLQRLKRAPAGAAAAPAPARRRAAAVVARTRPASPRQRFATPHRLAQRTVQSLPSRRAAAAAAFTAATAASDAAPLLAAPGDTVTLHWRCVDEEGKELESSAAAGAPLSFEVGAGDVVGNPVFETFDEAVRGRGAGEAVSVTARGAPWDRDLLFTVPRAHPEVARLEGRYQSQGGVRAGALVELSNGGVAVVVRADAEEVVLDANSMMAGKSLVFELELLAVERPGGGA